MMETMATQLALLEEPKANWQLDERTRELGRQGLAEARAALAQAVLAGAARRAA